MPRYRKGEPQKPGIPGLEDYFKKLDGNTQRSIEIIERTKKFFPPRDHKRLLERDFRIRKTFQDM